MLSGETRNIVCQKGSFAAAAATSVKSMQVVAGPNNKKSYRSREGKKEKVLVSLVCYIQS